MKCLVLVRGLELCIVFQLPPGMDAILWECIEACMEYGRLIVYTSVYAMIAGPQGCSVSV